MALFARTREDIATAKSRDPAARYGFEIWLTYPGVHAIWGYRWAHFLWSHGFRLPARVHSQFVRFLTGVEIHPAAIIGRRFFIDHGMGVVVGATAVIGDDVMLYHGVTLGGRATTNVKRHPTLGDDIVVGTGAVLLGPITIGSHSIIGAQAVVVADAPPNSVVTGIPAVARPRAGSQDSELGYTDPAIYI
jgi:serine O-acetyltransferase